MIDFNEIIKKFIKKNYIFLITISVLFLSLLFLPKMIIFFELIPGISIGSFIFLGIVGMITFFILYKTRNIVLFKYFYFIYSYFMVKLFFKKIRKDFSLNKYNPVNYIILKEMLFNKNIKLTSKDINKLIKNKKIFKGRNWYYLKLIIFSKLLSYEYNLEKYLWKSVVVEFPILKEIKEAIINEEIKDIEYIFQTDFLQDKQKYNNDELFYKIVKWMMIFECLKKDKKYNNFLKLNYERLAGLLYNLKFLAPIFVKYINEKYLSI